jgi:hypothetical protein
VLIGLGVLSIEEKLPPKNLKPTEIPGRFTLLLTIATYMKTNEYLNVYYGMSSFLTLEKEKKRKYYKSAKNITTKKRGKYLVNTRRSMVYPAIGLHTFPEGDIAGFDIDFLLEDNNLVTGWLQTSVWFLIYDKHKLYFGFEFIEQNNFNGPVENILDLGSAVFLKYKYSFPFPTAGFKVGFIVSSPHVTAEKLQIGLFDRFYFQLSLGMLF